MNFDYERATQMLNYFATKESGRINKMKAIKLAWAAERTYLRRHGELLTSDHYLAMTYGPVASNIKNLAYLESNFLRPEVYDYASKFIDAAADRDFVSIKAPDLEMLPNIGISILDEVYEVFKNLNAFELADFSHFYPEWKKHERLFPKNRVTADKDTKAPIDFEDFFKDIDYASLSAEDKSLLAALNKKMELTEDFFKTEEEVLEETKEIFEESRAKVSSLKIA